MSLSILVGDVRERLRGLPADSFDCVVTSPPYWGLRDYGTGKWIGGDPNCDHRSPTMRDGRTEDRAKLAGSAATNSHQLKLAHRSACGKCGAVKVDQQLGLEPTMGEHIAVMVDVFREVRRVLKPTGTLWLNYGDCYATSPNGRSAADTKGAGNDDRTFRDKPFSTIGGALKAKDLCMIPNRLAIALQEDGWWVRSEIIWGKPNPMPESIKDRPATSHEKVFLLAKSERYFYAGDDVRQVAAEASVSRWEQNIAAQEGSRRANGGGKTNGTMKAVGRTQRVRAEEIFREKGLTEAHLVAIRSAGISDTGKALVTTDGAGKNTAEVLALAAEAKAALGGYYREFLFDGARNLRNYEPAPPKVWNISTASFSDAHFATFPPELVERCLKAGCPKGGTVLDPFGGAGTTALVADQMQLDATIIELNPDYVHIAVRRIESDRGAIQNALDPLQIDLLQEGAT